MRGIAATYVELLRDARFVILVLVAALGMSGLFAYIAGAAFVLQGHYGLDQQAFALVFGAGAVALIGATQFNVVLLRRFGPQTIMVWALVAASLAGVVFVGVSHLPRRWAARLHGAGLGDPGRDGPGHPQRPGGGAVAASRAAGTAAALLGAAQFGLGAAVAPLVGVLGNDEVALALVMTAGMVVALLALLAARRAGHRNRGRRHRRRRRRTSLTRVIWADSRLVGHIQVRTVGSIVVYLVDPRCTKR